MALKFWLFHGPEILAWLKMDNLVGLYITGPILRRPLKWNGPVILAWLKIDNLVGLCNTVP